MTLFAGAFAFQGHTGMAAADKACWTTFFRGLPEAESRLHLLEQPQMLIWKWDCGAYGEPAWQQDANGSTAALCGDPLLTDADRRMDRMAQLQRLRHPTAGLCVEQLRLARGVFSIVAYDAPTAVLRLATDRIGIRPVFYAIQDGVFYFASALHLLERLPGLRRTICMRGLTEELAFGFPLADRTPYQEISLLREASLLQVDSQGLKCSPYFDWNAVKVQATDIEQAGRQVFDAFAQSVALRLDGHPVAYAFLSGGMDSRSIVATLATHECVIEAMNFSYDDTQDKAFAIAYAASLEDRCKLSLHPTHNFPNFSLLAQAALRERAKGRAAEPAKAPEPRLLWSGDGGSVCLGYVYLDDEMMRLAQAGNWQQATRTLLTKNNLITPSPLLKRSHRHDAQDRFVDGVVEELVRYDNLDNGRRLYFFLLFNDQRRHLFKHFETIHEHKLELHLPFFDADFVEQVVRTPASWGLGHRLYGRFFTHLPARTRTVPWQTYPKHEPCPIAPPQAPRNQWVLRAPKPSFAARKTSASAMLRLARRSALADCVSRVTLMTRSLLHLSGLRNYDYMSSATAKLLGLQVNTPASPRPYDPKPIDRTR